ncbi:MAG: hypothetical protein AAF943_17745 [Pseudomonadota bacterium]
MPKTFSLFLAITLVLVGCATIRESRVNPLNWFGNARSEPLREAENTNPLIPRGGGLFARARAENEVYQGAPLDQITNLTIERIPGGAIIRATGVAARQGIYEVQLTPENDDELPVDGVLTYRLEGVLPEQATPQGTQPTREVTAARRLTDQDLQAVRQIRVEGRRNALVSRR